MRKEKSIEQHKIEVAQRYLQSLSFTSLKLYSVNPSSRYITTTTMSNLKSRCEDLGRGRTVMLSYMDPLVAAIAQSLKSVAIQRTLKHYPTVDACVEFYSLWKNIGTVYFHTESYTITVEKNIFSLKENDPIFAAVKNAIAKKIGNS